MVAGVGCGKGSDGVTQVEGVSAGNRIGGTHGGIGVNQRHGDGVVGEGGRKGGVACHNDGTRGVGVAVVPLHEVSVGGGHSRKGGGAAMAIGTRTGHSTHHRAVGRGSDSVLVGCEVSRQVEGHARHEGGNHITVGTEGYRVGENAERNHPVGEVVAGVGHCCGADGVAYVVGVGAGSGQGGTHGGVVRSNVDGHRSRKSALAADETVERYSGSGCAAGDFADGVGRSVAIDVTGYLNTVSVCNEAAARCP